MESVGKPAISGLERFREGGMDAMNEKSRRPHSHAKELSEEVVCRIVKLKHAHPRWGPRKIRNLYERKHGGDVPSESSFKRVLEKAGLTLTRHCCHVFTRFTCLPAA